MPEVRFSCFVHYFCEVVGWQLGKCVSGTNSFGCEHNIMYCKDLRRGIILEKLARAEFCCARAGGYFVSARHYLSEAHANVAFRQSKVAIGVHSNRVLEVEILPDPFISAPLAPVEIVDGRLRPGFGGGALRGGRPGRAWRGRSLLVLALGCR